MEVKPNAKIINVPNKLRMGLLDPHDRKIKGTRNRGKKQIGTREILIGFIHGLETKTINTYN